MSVMSQEIQAIDKQVMALKLRQSGLEYSEIAKLCGYKSASGAYHAIKSALKKTIQEPADQLRAMELRRLDEAQAAIWAAVTKGNLSAIDRFLKISRRRAELLGLDAPVGIAGEINVNHRIDIDSIRQKRWEQVAGILGQLPDNGDAFDSIEVEVEEVDHEKVTPEVE